MIACKLCDFISMEKITLVTHVKSKHEGIKFPCNETIFQFICKICDHFSCDKDNLMRHVQAIHEGIKFPCDQCDYQATTEGILLTHKKSKHKLINPFMPGGRFINHLFFNFLSLIKIKIKTVLISKLSYMTTTTKLIIW